MRTYQMSRRAEPATLMMMVLLALTLSVSPKAHAGMAGFQPIVAVVEDFDDQLIGIRNGSGQKIYVPRKRMPDVDIRPGDAIRVYVQSQEVFRDIREARAKVAR